MRDTRKTRMQRRKEKRQVIRIIISNIILFILVAIISYMSYGIYKEAQIKTIDLDNTNIILSQENNNIIIERQNNEEINLVDKKYLGYEVSCRLEIPKIDFNSNVLEKYSKEGLNICISKYYGPSANEVGNYCIAGHNQQNMFNYLIDLQINDEIILIDNKNGIVRYSVYDKYKVKPENIKPLSQETGGKREITLITCVNYSRNRLIIKAREI